MRLNNYLCYKELYIMDLAERKYNFIAEIFTVEEETFEKLEKILKKDKIEKTEVPLEHIAELDKRLESYRENPQNLLDWEEIKKDW
jgi:hypothetical protein